jgi:hypothetical protein
MTTRSNPVAEWLESREGETWSRDHHRAAHAGESHLPNHIASVRPTPGRDPVWDRGPSKSYFDRGVRNPEHDPSGRPPMTRTAQGRGSR